MEYLAVELQILLLGAVVGMFCPQRRGLVQELRALLNLQLDGFRLFLFFVLFFLVRFLRCVRLFRGILFFLFLLFLLRLIVLFLRLDHLQDFIVLALLVLPDNLGLCGVGLGQVNLRGHEGAVLLQHLPGLVLVAELQAVLVEEQGDRSAYLCPVPILHGEFGAAVALPVNSLGALLVGQGVDVHLVRHHEGGIEAQSEMADDLVRVALVLIFLYEVGCAGEGDLVDVLLHLVRGHAQSIVHEGQGLLLRVHDDVYPRLVPLRQGILAHHVQLLQLRHGVAAVGDQLPVKDVVVVIQPLFDDRKNVFAVD